MPARVLAEMPIEVWSAAQAKAADSFTMSVFGASSESLVERAALAVTGVVYGLGPSRVHVLVGKGMNGADGLACARQLVQRGMDVSVTLVEGAERQSVHAGLLASAIAYGVTLRPSIEQSDSNYVLVDALLGVGASGELRDDVKRMLAAKYLPAAHVVAIDLPSGLNPDTGIGDALGIVADHTVTMEALKPGLLFGPQAHRAGKISVARIGLVRAHVERAPVIVSASRVRGLLESLKSARHKGERGHLGVVGGSSSTPGAPRLAAAAAMALGVGLVTLARFDGGQAINVADSPELMFAALRSDEVWLPRADAFVVGPGYDVQIGGELATLQDDPRPAVWDASGRDILNAPISRSVSRIITPHPAEAARLLDRLEKGTIQWSTARVVAEPLLAHQRLVELTRAVVLLKGERTIIGDLQRRAIIVGDAPALAVGGSGDVLAGLIGGLLARGLDAFDAAVAGSFLHAMAGQETAGALSGLIASDIIRKIPAVVARVLQEEDHAPIDVIWS